MKIAATATFAVLTVALVGCTGPSIDTSSDDAMESSIERVRSSLPEARRDTFDLALQTLAISQIDLADAFAGEVGAAAFRARTKAVLEGKSGPEVIELARRIWEEQAEAERQREMAELEDLRDRRVSSETARRNLAAFEVRRARFSSEEGFFGREPRVRMTVVNGTGASVSRAYFRGQLRSEGRSIPWVDEEFNYSIRGGLEPGEEQTWNLSPNMFSEWGTTDAPADARLKVTVVRLDGPDGENLFGDVDWDHQDDARLAELEERHG